MVEVKTIPKAQLYAKSAEQITSDLRDGKYSLLESIGCHDLLEEMRPAGSACCKILRLAEIRAGNKKDRHYPQRLRKAISGILDKGAPYRIVGTFPHLRCGLVIGFNHPTLGEIIRLVSICASKYPNRRFLFPVNIAWYEVLAPVARRMEKFGLYISPTITPATREKMDRLLDEDDMKFVGRIAKGFNAQYMCTCADFIEGGNIILIAPSATRQTHVFKNYDCFHGTEAIEPQTMTYTAMALERKVIDNYYFLPVAVIPPKKCSRGLNLLKRYTFSPALWISRDTAKHMCNEKSRITGDRKFEHFFLDTISDELVNLDADYLIYPQPKGKGR